jgi:hypothetical protein
MNPRYLAYCRAHGRTPAEMLEHDDKEWPGGKMTGFILWLDEQWMEFEKRHQPPLRRISQADRGLWRVSNTDAFDVWLQDAYPPLKGVE